MSGDSHDSTTAVDNQQFESLPAVHRDPRGARVRAAGPGGRLWTGGRLLIGMYTFLFASLAFAYFYLRSANNEELWRPRASPLPPASARPSSPSSWPPPCLVHYGEWRFRASRDARLGGERLGGRPRRAPGRSGSRSGSSPSSRSSPGRAATPPASSAGRCMNIALLLAGAYWLETILAREIRLRRAMAAGWWRPGLDASGGPPLPGQPERVHLLLGLHRRRRDPVFWVLFYVI